MSKYSLLFLLISFCFSYKHDETKIYSFQPTKFQVSKANKVSFKYAVSKETKSIGIYFYLANIYSTKVKIPELKIEYSIGQNQYNIIKFETMKDQEITIEIVEDNNYYYTDYIMIYNPFEQINLEDNKVLSIYNFVDENYTFIYNNKNNSTLEFNALNTVNKSDIVVYINGSNAVTLEEPNMYYKKDINEIGPVTITIQKLRETTTEISIVVHSKENLFGYQALAPKEGNQINYICLNKPQEFYYYVNITGQKMNTINIKLNHQYYNLTNLTSFYYKFSETVQYTDILEPIDNKLIQYDNDSDQYIKYYFTNPDISKEQFLLLKIKIDYHSFFSGERSIKVSIGDKIEELTITSGNSKQIELNLKDNIPIYYELNVGENDIYILGQSERDILKIIKGDLIKDNQINKDSVSTENELAVLRGNQKYILQFFGSTVQNTPFFIEKKNKNELIVLENARNNYVYEINCEKDENKSVIGTFNYEQYLYDQGEKVNYYATVDSGEFEIFFKNKSNFVDETFFPKREGNKIETNKILLLDSSTDLFYINCKSSGKMSIRPEKKNFGDKKVDDLKQNEISPITAKKEGSILQLTTPLGIRNQNLYLSIYPKSQSKITIEPDTKGLFDKKTIDNEVFYLPVNLNEYKMDQLALIITSDIDNSEIEVLEVIHEQSKNYKIIKNGANEIAEIKHADYLIEDNDINITFNFENMTENSKVSYAIISTPIKESDYLLPMDIYKLEKKDFTITKENHTLFINFNHTVKNGIKNFEHLLLSFPADSSSFSISAEIFKEERQDTDTTTSGDTGGDGKEGEDDNQKFVIIGAVVGGLLVSIILIIIIVCVVKKRNKIRINSQIEQLYNDNKKSEENAGVTEPAGNDLLPLP